MKLHDFEAAIIREAQRIFSNMTPREFMANPKYHTWFTTCKVLEHYMHNPKYERKLWYK